MTPGLLTPGPPAADAGRDAARRRRLVRRFAARMVPAMVLSNTAGACGVFLYLSSIEPPDDGRGVPPAVYAVVFAAYLGGAVLLGTLGTFVVVRRLLGWLRGEPRDVRGDLHDVLAVPARVVRLYAALWLVGVVVFGAMALTASVARAGDVVSGVLLGALTTCALSGLLAERFNRPLVAEVMRGRGDAPPVLLSVRRRLLLSWALGTGVPVFGLVVGILDPNESGRITDGGILFLAGAALVAGLLCIEVAARSVADPVRDVTRAIAGVGEGRLDVEVAVDDASEVGQLQAGVNRMVQGLRERDRLRDLYGRQVGADVARLSLEEGVRLGGERRDVAVLFVDVVGSTRLAVEVQPEEVVERLNAFFAVVVDVVTRHGGWVNKFEGDAALCVFGAPVPHADPATGVLRAARELAAGLAPLPLEAAVGVCAGPVVAGHVGAVSRFEYTVVGDPVNAAARLTELAKAAPGRVLADAAVVAAADPAEAARWQPGGEVVLRGRTAATGLSSPRG